MSIWRIIFANLKHSRRQHLGTSLCLALASMILVGSLTIGDSVRNTLWQKAAERIGMITHVFVSSDGYFHSDLADRLLVTEDLPKEVMVAPVVMATGTIASPDGKLHASGITVLGIDERFFQLAWDSTMSPDLKKLGFWASPELARELGVEQGSRLILRVEDPSLFSRDAPLSGERDARFVSWNRPYLGEVNPSALGNFSLQASMEPARTIFMPLSMMQNDMFITFSPDERKDFANLLLVAGGEGLTDSLMAMMKRCWTLKDAGLETKKLRAVDRWNLRSRKVFLSDKVVHTARQIDPTLEAEFTYLVNAIGKPEAIGDGNASLIPYSMVTGVEPKKGGILEPEWHEGKMAINQWAAIDLNISLGDLISIEYFVVGDRRELIEKTTSFEVGKILPMPEKIPKGDESDWTPRFPGLSDADNCGEWDTGIPIKHKIRSKDESYWDDYRGTPKAFISLTRAQEMWGNRWGNVTGLRINGRERANELGKQLRNILDPRTFGLRLIHFEKKAIDAVSGPVDFSQLFLSFGFFVLLAGLSLSALIFGFSLEQRNRQVGMLLSLGYTLRKVNFITSMEAGVVCLLGTLMGVGWAWFFGSGVLWMLNNAWGSAVAKLTIYYAPRLESIVLGAGASFLMGLICLLWITRKQRKYRPVELIQSGAYNPNSLHSESFKKRLYRSIWIEPVAWVALICMILTSSTSKVPPSVSFFCIGFMVLFAGLVRVFRYFANNINNRKLRDRNLLLNLDYRTGRKITGVGILAVGTFLIVGAGAFRKSQSENTLLTRSETGGFTHIIKTSLPLYDDLMSENARDLYDLNDELLSDVTVVPLRTQAGDDASCLNLHNSSSPPLYGVPILQMEKRFNFVEGNWSALKKSDNTDLLPAAIDHNTMLWSLKKNVGDRISYLDSEGQEFEVKLTAVVEGSFLQGGLYISEENWVKKYPNQGGYQEFWISGSRVDRTVDHLLDRFFNYGPRSQTVVSRLEQLKNVENTYLSIFQALGGLGVLLGTLGILIIIVRNLWERRHEQALLGAVGFSLPQLHKLVMRENARIIFWGLITGLMAGLVGLIPTILENSEGFSIISLTSFGGGLFILSYISLVIAIRIGLPKLPINTLRDE